MILVLLPLLIVAVLALAVAWRLTVGPRRRTHVGPFRFHDPHLARAARIARRLSVVMATEIPGKLHTYVAGADLSASQFLFLVTDGNGNVIVNTTAGAECVGVLQDKPTSGMAACVMVDGVSKVIAGAAIPFVAGGTPVMSNNAGRAVAATAGNQIMGWIRNSTAAAAGEVCSVELQRYGKA